MRKRFIPTIEQVEKRIYPSTLFIAPIIARDLGTEDPLPKPESPPGENPGPGGPLTPPPLPPSGPIGPGTS